MTAPPLKITGNAEKTLDRLLREPALNSFGLALFDGKGHLLASNGTNTAFCSSPENLLCSEDCRTKRKKEFFDEVCSGTPQLLTCPAGLWHYLLPCQTESNEPCVLIAGGSRSCNINLPYIEDLALRKRVSALSLLEFWEQLPVLDIQDVMQAGRLLQRLLAEPIIAKKPILSDVTPPPGSTDLIKALALAESGLIQAESRDAIIIAVTKALAPHYTDRQVALFLPERDGEELDWLFSEKPGQGMPTSESEENQDGQITCLPLQAKDEFFGCLVLFAPPPSPSDLFLLKILADRIAGRLEQLRDAPTIDATAEHPAESQLKQLKELGSISELGELCRRILETACQLSQADKGSLMLLDHGTGKLRLQASIGMNSAMADNLSIPPDQGITGLVMRSGQPLLVHDMTKDQRIQTTPRPRFRTRSLLSLPLHASEGLLGVLNLSDKQGDVSFGDNDLNLLSTWCGYCVPLIERLSTHETLRQLKQEAAIDPLTGAYNQPMLTKRFAEEVSRCSRSRQELVLLLVDADQHEQDESANKLSKRQAIAPVMDSLLRKMDVIARLDSGPFAILLPDTSPDGALIIAERLRARIEEELAAESLTISGGLALFPIHGASFNVLLQSAGAALQQAQSSGGNAIFLTEKTSRNNKIVYL